jgi:hypothetical protein
MIRGTSFIAETISVGGEPARPERTQAERNAAEKAERVDRACVKKATNLDEEEINSRKFGFPGCRLVPRFLDFGADQVWRRGEVIEWRDRMIAFGDRLKGSGRVG